MKHNNELWTLNNICIFPPYKMAAWTEGKGGGGALQSRSQNNNTVIQQEALRLKTHR